MFFIRAGFLGSYGARSDQERPANLTRIIDQNSEVLGTELIALKGIRMHSHSARDANSALSLTGLLVILIVDYNSP
jgi:hypothetical protein